MVVDSAERCLSNSLDAAGKILAEMGETTTGFFPGGSCWVWDVRDPRPGGAWRLFLNRWPVDVRAAEYLDPAKVDQVRLQAASLVDSFPGTVQHLEQLDCWSAEAVYSPITTPDDIIGWACSIWNACVPRPSTKADPAAWPWAVVGTAALVKDGWEVVHPDLEGYVAVLPQDDRSRVYWASPGLRYKQDELLGSRHPVTRRARHGQSSLGAEPTFLID